MQKPESTFHALTRSRNAPFLWRLEFWLGIGYIGWLLTAPEKTRPTRLASVGFLAALNFVVAWALGRAAQRQTLPGRVQKALRFIASGLATTGLGGAYLLIEVLLNPSYQSTFSVADGLFLLSYPLIVVGLAQFPLGEQPMASRWRIALDGAACVVGVGIPLWLGAVAPAWREATGMDAMLIVIWPCVAFIGLVVVNTALLTRAPLPTCGAVWFLLAGIGVSWLADLIFSLDASALVIRRSAINWINVANAVALCLSLIAAWRFQSDPISAHPRMRPASISPVPVATMLIVAAWLIVLSIASTSDPQMLHRILPGLIILFFVLLVREMLVLRDTVNWMGMAYQRESRARIEAMVRHSSDVLMVVDAQCLIKFASPSLTAIVGLDAERLVGQSLLQFLHSEDIPQAQGFFHELLQNPAAVATIQWRLRHADGTYRHFETSGSNAFREPMVGGLVLNSRDITERKQAEKEILRLAREQQIIVENANIGISLVRDRRQVWLNDKASEMFGYPRAELEGQTTRKLYPSQEAYDKLGRDAYPTLAEGGSYETLQELVRADGTHIWVRYNGKTIDPEDMSKGALWLLEDITERVEQQQAVQNMLKQTEQDARTKAELLREVNHRVANNLTAVLGLMAFEKSHARSDPQSITTALARLDQRIRGLLQVHRMLSHSAWAPVPVHQLAGEIIHAALQAAHWQQSAVVTVRPGEERVSPRQAGALAMVINELTTNTVKYGNPAGGSVTIAFEAESDPEGMTLCYRDNGPGYPSEVLAQERSNIGLKLIKELVQGSLGGQVALANDHGAVTTLRIRLEEETRT